MTAKADEWADDQFTEVAAEESPTSVVLDRGDVFKGVYVGPQHVTDPNTGKEWDQFLFRAGPNHDGIDQDELCALGGKAIEDGMGGVPVGARVRLECVKEIDTRKGNPYKSVKITYRA